MAQNFEVAPTFLKKKSSLKSQKGADLIKIMFVELNIKATKCNKNAV
jgi:hypothetical protein